MLGACVVRLWSHVVVPVFRELLCLGRCMPRYCFCSGLTPLVLRESCLAQPWLWVMASTLFRCFVVLCIRCVPRCCFRIVLTLLVLRESCLAQPWLWVVAFTLFCYFVVL
ncbi:hypothetical protein Taro_040454 [Colocasia esculenta]|uniref:Uncharacterized protein n=1 Tax=Colocasia esculenta TaxID=4460 RepID=A0A843WIS7_COLES|nr:hypothetical protein [Colocasia esculenta]